MSRRDLRVSLDDATWQGLHALAENYHATPERMARSWVESEVATRLGQLLAGMPTELVVPGVGTFVEVPSPDESRCWTIRGCRPPGAEESLTASVLVAPGELPPDVSFVARTMRRWAELGAIARGTAVERLGLPDGAGLDGPELTFRSGRRWAVRLAGHDVLVEFDGARVTGVEDLTGP